MARAFYRKFIDKQGNIYCVEIPHDVDPENMEDIMIGISDRIVKLHAYQLVGDVYRAPDNVELANNGKDYTFYKKVSVFEVYPSISEEDFGNSMKELLDNARNYRINRAEITHFEGKPVKKDQRGFYLEREVPCFAEGCSHTIKGEQRLSMSDGVISRAQSFVPYDKESQRARPGSKQWLCPSCVARSVPIPEHLQVKSITETVEQPEEEAKIEEKVVKSSIPKNSLEKLLELASEENGNSDYFKGYARGILESIVRG